MTTLQESLFSSSALLLLLITIFYSTTTSAQLSPIQSPATAALPPTPATLPKPTPASAPAAAPGMNTVPIVPASPNVAAPTPALPKAPTIDIVQILTKAKRFSVLIRLLKTTQLINQLNSQLLTSGSGGLTIFAPEDSAFSKLKPGLLNSLDDKQKVELLQFHTISSFISISNFDTLTNPVQTQAGDDPERLQLNVTTDGGSRVSMTTGVVNATVTGTVYSDNKLAIYQLDKVLLPIDIVIPKKATAPAPAKGDSPKSGKKKSADESTAGDDNDDNNNGAVTVDSSSGSMRFNVWVRWVTLVLGVVFLGGAVI